jgi:segregation and condensation protein A
MPVGVPAPAYQIDLPVFSGPFDLLLHLIERQELDITAVSLLKVTQQYLAQVERLKENKIEQLIDFLVIGARLTLIKSRALLPQMTRSYSDDEEEEDPAEALTRQLRLYKQFKAAANWLGNREKEGWRAYLRLAAPPPMENRLDLTGVNATTLATAVQAALSRTERQEESVSLVQRRTLTIEGQMGHLRQTLQRRPRLTFGELLSAQPNREEVSVTLLAVLELLKRREAQVAQSWLLGPIQITRNTAAEPVEGSVALSQAASPAQPLE